MNVVRSMGIAVVAWCSVTAHAQDPAACRTVHFADIGWTDIAATTALASAVFEGLGYQPVKTIASIPIALAGLKSNQTDVFLGDWQPSMDVVSAPFVKSGAVKVLAQPNLTGAKYTLAVPDYVYNGGLKSFADIQKYADRLGGRIYGIEPGNDGNALIKKMIDGNQFGLGKFRLVESSEAGMLVEVNRAIRDKQWIVFLGWEPHPMNLQMKMRYLSGGDTVFGPNYGEAKVYTMTSPSYAARCPNASGMVSNLKFTTDMENQVMLSIMTNHEQPNVAAKQWLQQHPTVLTQWLAGVTTFDGHAGLPAVKSYLAAK
jgi:glycine betaine/proline transport system substrate-binding protein